MKSRRSHAAVVAWLRHFWPVALAIPVREQWRILAGATLGILLTAVIGQWLAPAGAAWLIAPVGASAVLVFGVPSSPLAQPWSVVGGNTVSALVGTACALLVPDTNLAAALAVALSIGAMMCARCRHPPGGAVALIAVLAPHPAWSFAAFPVLFNSVALVLVGVAFNSLTGRTYPHAHALEPTPLVPPQSSRLTRADLDAALKDYNQVLDVAPEDLVELLEHAQTVAYRRT